MKRSAGILMYKFINGEPFVLLVHPGGPFWSKKDFQSWSIPKGEYSEEEDPLAAAIREFDEETGAKLHGDFHLLGEIVQRNRKIVTAWAIEGDFDPKTLKSNTCEVEWPPKSGRVTSIPEVDRAEWFNLGEARKKINAGQIGLLDRLERKLMSAPK
jgi:predicted NUDIX family NTP pyrophosphohydrolase